MKNFFFIFGLFLSLFFNLSCAPVEKPPKKLYLQYLDEVSPDFQNKIENAIIKINEEAGKEIVSLNRKEGKPLVFLQLQTGEMFAHAEYLDYRCLIQIDENNQIVNSNDPEQLDIRYILLHEIGHCYGYQHSDDINDIMFPTYSGKVYMSSPQIVQARQRITNFLEVLTRRFF